jgi:hypothetical protein
MSNPPPSNSPPSKLATARLAEILPRVEASAPAAAVAAPCASVEDALEALLQGGFRTEAMRLVAHALPRREGVWWACMCVRHTASATATPADGAAIDAAELWVRRPNDENRRLAFSRAEAAKFATAEAWAAVAAFWSGESMAPAGQPVVPPPPHLTGVAIVGAVTLASVRTRPEERDKRLDRFLASARDIAAGGVGRMPPESV